MLVLVFGLFLSLIFAASSSASELDSGITDIDINIDSDHLPYRVVTEEYVIQTHMELKGVDRETAIKELGIENTNLLESNSTSDVGIQADNPSCFYEWREYKAPRRLVDSASSSYITAYPLIQIKDCSSTNLFIIWDVSPTVRITKENAWFYPLDFTVVEGSDARKKDNNYATVRAWGYITNKYKHRLREWSYLENVYKHSSSGGGGTFSTTLKTY